MHTLFIGLVTVSATVLGAAAMLAGSATTASAANERWCSTGNIGQVAPTRCDFRTFAQCRATVRGVGGSCIENPDLAWARSGRQRYRDDYRSGYRDDWQWR